MNIQEDSYHCPSFNMYSNTKHIAEITANNYNAESDGYAFEFLVDSSLIRPIYPVFDRDMIPDQKSEISNTPIQLKELFIEDDHNLYNIEDEYDDPPPASFCLWVPKSPSPRCIKSNSTGSSNTPTMSKSWRLRNLLRRCKSDGKEGLELVSPHNNVKNNTGKNNDNDNAGCVKDTNNKKKNRSQNQNNYNGNHRSYYYDKGLLSPTRGQRDNQRRSYLPYKQELLGFFGTPQMLRKLNFPPF